MVLRIRRAVKRGAVDDSGNILRKDEGTSKAYTHEVVVRPLENGEFQYVSNKMLPSKDDYGMGWHTDRMTEEEWNEAYEEKAVR